MHSAPDLPAQDFTRDDVTLPLDEIEQQIEFAWRQRDLAVAPICPPCFDMQHEVAEPPTQIFAGPGAAQPGTDASHQFSDLERLHEEIIRPNLETADSFFDGVQSAHQENRRAII